MLTDHTSRLLDFDDVFGTVNYPSGEFHLIANHFPRTGSVIIANIFNFNDIAKCVLGDRILTRNRIDVDWVFPFLPFSREDRRNTRKDGMELSLALEMLSELGGATIDPHSDVSGQKILYFPQSEVVREFELNGLFEGDVVVAIPDAGAAKKAYTWLERLKLPYIQCLKKRDVETGKLSGFEVVGDPNLNLNGKDIVIVDDICDGGGTFIGLANELKKDNPASLRLAVSHGLFTKGFFDLEKLYDKIYFLDHIDATQHWFTEKSVKVSFENIIERGNYL